LLLIDRAFTIMVRVGLTGCLTQSQTNHQYRAGIRLHGLKSMPRTRFNVPGLGRKEKGLFRQ
jgi:hypothetical protein